MSRSVAQFEQEFKKVTVKDRRRRQFLRQEVAHRKRTRHRIRTVKLRNFRYVGLVLAVFTTAVIVTVAMFETLAWLMG